MDFHGINMIGGFAFEKVDNLPPANINNFRRILIHDGKIKWCDGFTWHTICSGNCD